MSAAFKPAFKPPSKMRVIFLMLRKDLLRRRRDPLAVLLMLAFPLIFAGLLALAFGGAASLPSADLLVQNDDPMVGSLIVSALGLERFADLVEVREVGAEGLAILEAGEASALLRIPEGATASLLRGEAVTLELIRNPSQETLPEIAEQLTATLADVLGLLGRFLQERKVDLGLEDLTDFEALKGADFGPVMVAMRVTWEVGERYLKETPLELRVFEAEDDGEMREAEKLGSGASGQSIAVFIMVLPGLAVYALFLIGDQMMRDILTENQDGTLRRQLAAPITAAQVVIAKVLTAGVVGAAALLVLTGILVVLAGVRINFPAFAALAAAIVLSATGFATIIYGVVRNDRQGSALSSMANLMLAFSGGAFIPLSQLPDALRAISPISPFYWGTQGLRSLLADGAGLIEVLPAIGVLTAVGVSFLTIGSALLHRRMLQGGGL